MRKSLSNWTLQSEDLSKIICYQDTHLLGISFLYFLPATSFILITYFEVRSVTSILQMRLVEVLRLARTRNFIPVSLPLSPRCFQLNPLSFWAILPQFKLWSKCPICQIDVFKDTLQEAQCIPVAIVVNSRN